MDEGRQKGRNSGPVEYRGPGREHQNDHGRQHEDPGAHTQPCCIVVPLIYAYAWGLCSKKDPYPFFFQGLDAFILLKHSLRLGTPSLDTQARYSRYVSSKYFYRSHKSPTPRGVTRAIFQHYWHGTRFDTGTQRGRAVGI